MLFLRLIKKISELHNFQFNAGFLGVYVTDPHVRLVHRFTVVARLGLSSSHDR